jgi:hypothetical protein
MRSVQATDGEVVCYWNYGQFLDANAGPVIAAWDYVESTGDKGWLKERIEQLEFISDFLARRDTDGLVDAVQSGNLNTLKMPGRSCCWFDCLSGGKDGYSNAIIYRAWRCLADLEDKLGRAEQRRRYTELADKLKAAYVKTLYNRSTGWLAWWKSADGRLHDYASPAVNGLAIEYGLIEPALGGQILARLRAKMEQAGFQRFDLGVPCTLVPVLRGDYLTPGALGGPTREDGTDTFGQYMNGGITAAQTLQFIAAHYVVGEDDKADAMLQAMLGHLAKTGFQSRVGGGIDWNTWNGRACGYEGYLADCFRFLQAVPPQPEPKKITFNVPDPPQPIDCCECGPDRPCKDGKVWTRQHADLRIAEGDLIGDCNNGRELLNLCATRGIDTLLYMGVASNKPLVALRTSVVP